MATFTPNYNLSKPETTDEYKDFIDSYGDNMDIIDQNMGGGGGGGGHTIVDPTGTDMPQENKLQFIGAVSVSDDSVNGQTVVDVEGGGNYYLNTIYSTEEKKVGYWADGKPLYQKTFDLGSDIAISNTTWYSSIVSITNVENIPLCFGLYSGGTYYPLMAYHTGDNVNVLACRANSGATVRYLTLHYTKTTDTPEPNPQTGGVIYLPSIYSEEEREIGCFVDGKPLYQKTVNFGSLPANNGSKTVAHGISNLETLVNAVFVVQSSAQFRTLPNVSRGNVTNQTVWYMTATDIGVLTGSNADVGSAYSGYVTIQYTKTTDTAGSGAWTPSGANAVHYSTNEQVIGTWIDGKPIYEITYSGLSVVCTNANQGYATNIDWGNIKKVIHSDIIDQYGQSCAGSVVYTGTPAKLAVFMQMSNRTVTDITIQYTKTTD